MRQTAALFVRSGLRRSRMAVACRRVSAQSSASGVVDGAYKLSTSSYIAFTLHCEEHS